MSERATVLLVDDEPNVTRSIRRMLREESYVVREAHSADEALETMGRERVAVVVTDEKMPGRSGAELLGEIRLRYPEAVGLMLTGEATVDAAVRAVNEGAVFRILLKPCTPLELRLALRQALQHRELLGELRRLCTSQRRYREELIRVEQENPGTTAILRDTDGAILVEDPLETMEQLLRRL